MYRLAIIVGHYGKLSGLIIDASSQPRMIVLQRWRAWSGDERRGEMARTREREREKRFVSKGRLTPAPSRWEMESRLNGNDVRSRHVYTARNARE